MATEEKNTDDSRLNLRISNRDRKLLEEQSAELGHTSLTETIRVSLALTRILMKLINNEGVRSVIVIDKDGEKHKIVIP